MLSPTTKKIYFQCNNSCVPGHSEILGKLSLKLLNENADGFSKIGSDVERRTSTICSFIQGLGKNGNEVMG